MSIERALRPPRDPGRLIARLLCALFALIGALPLVAGLLVRTDTVLLWTSAETSRVLREELGVEATYKLRIELWPAAIALEDVEVPSNDGGPPAITTDRITVRPRVFSLLAGRLDAGDIELERPSVRLVIKDGALQNLSYRLPKSDGPKAKLERAPFSSLGISDARIALELDGISISAQPIDLDVFAEAGPTFEIALRAGETRFTRTRVETRLLEPESTTTLTEKNPRTTTFDAVDEDVVCRTELRLRVDREAALVRRLALVGIVDADPAKDTTPSCATSTEEDPARVLLRLSQVRLEYRKSQTPLVDGHVVVRAPARLANRFADMPPVFGWIGFAGDVRYDGKDRMPEVRGKLRGAGLGLDVYRLAHTLESDVEVSRDRISVAKLTHTFADGDMVLRGLRISPFEKGVPLTAERVEGTNVTFPGLMRDLGVTPDTIVRWDLSRTVVTQIKGTISPLRIDGELSADTKNFEVTDKSFRHPGRKHMVGVRNATVRGRFGVRPKSLDFYDIRSTFGKSVLLAKVVSIGFHNDLALEVSKGTRLDLSDISPLIDIPWAGVAEMRATMRGKSGNPVLTGEMSVSKFEFGGFPLGDIKSAKIRFQPLVVDFSEVSGHKGTSDFRVSSARLDFDSESSVKVDARVHSERFDIRDFFAMFLFDKDPRFDPIFGRGKVDARVHYDLGGRRDRCGGGFLRVDGAVDFPKLELFEERYDSGQANFDFRWLDRDASYQGIELDVPNLRLTKGPGTLLGSLSLRPGGVVRGHMVGTSVPLSRIDAMGSLAPFVEARGSGTAEIFGTVDALRVSSQVRLSPLRAGSAQLPASALSVILEPSKRPIKVVGKTRCGGDVTAEFDPNEYKADPPQGTFVIAGQLFGGQARFENLRVTRQRNKRVQGRVNLVGLDLGAVAELSPTVALSSSKPRGSLSAQIDIEQLRLERITDAEVTVRVASLELQQGDLKVAVLKDSAPIALSSGALRLERLAIAVSGAQGERGVFDLRGAVRDLATNPTVEGQLSLRPVDLASLAGSFPRVERIKGRLDGSLRVKGPIRSMRYSGGFALSGGEAVVRGFPSAITDLEVRLTVDEDELRLSRATARLGNGTLSVTGSAPLRGLTLGTARAVITARDLTLPVEQGIRATLDTSLVATWQPSASDAKERSLPRITGDVVLKSFEYTRPITMSADLNTLAQRGKRTAFESYDPADDSVVLDLNIKATRSLTIRNNLVDAELTLAQAGLELSGTNQRFGFRGEVGVKPGGRIRMRRSEFEVRQGTVRFDDLTRIAPKVDVTAVTEYRRYSDLNTTDTSGSSDATGSATAGQGGRWLVTMHAHGDAENLRIDLTSDPALAQDDIFLLLTVGLTRAELDQTQSASVGESVALETLGTLSGADQAVTRAVPVIDEFRFGSAYSSRTGRTEPTVTIGKRLADRIRANVTSGLADSREIRSNLEWRLSNRVSVEGSYDNVNDISSSTLGNLGADIRWRLEFE